MRGSKSQTYTNIYCLFDLTLFLLNIRLHSKTTVSIQSSFILFYILMSFIQHLIYIKSYMFKKKILLYMYTHNFIYKQGSYLHVHYKSTNTLIVIQTFEEPQIQLYHHKNDKIHYSCDLHRLISRFVLDLPPLKCYYICTFSF